MSKLRCIVSDCTHNCDRLCMLGSIKVEGQNAHSSALTFCHSFVPRIAGGGPRTENVRGTEVPATVETHIACDALHCTYNKDSICAAGQVEVQGDPARTPSDTRCATFRPDSAPLR